MTHFLDPFLDHFFLNFSSSFSWLFDPQNDPPFTVKNPWKSPLENPIQNCDSEGIFLGVEFHEKPPSDRGSHRQNPPFPFLYINPYDTGSIFFFLWKMCTFQYPFSRKFFNWRKFRSKPRCKIIVTAGGVVQVGRKRAPQGTFHRNFTPPHERRELNRTNFSSSGERFFDISRNFSHHKRLPPGGPPSEARNDPQNRRKISPQGI